MKTPKPTPPPTHAERGEVTDAFDAVTNFLRATEVIARGLADLSEQLSESPQVIFAVAKFRHRLKTELEDLGVINGKQHD